MAGALIGALRVSLSAETTAFEAGMKRSQRQAATTARSIQGSFKGIGNSLKAGIAGFVGALSVGTIVQGVRAALDYAGSLGEVAQQLGVTTRDLQTFRYAAGQTGVAQEQLETGLQKLTISLGKVAAGAKAPTAALNAIGISVDQIKGKDTGEAFRLIADGLQKVTDRSQRAAIEVALFGRSGAQLDTLLAGGSGALNELALAAEKLGIVLSDKEIQQADVTADKLDAIQTVLKANIASIVANNSDAILDLANAFAKAGIDALAAVPKIIAFFRAVNEQQIRFRLASLDVADILPFGDENRAKIRAKLQGQLQGIQRQRGGERFGALFQGRPTSVGGGADIGQFLASGGGGKKGKTAEQLAAEAERKRLDALRDANQFDQQIRRAKTDVLHAEQQLAVNADERLRIAIEILDAERSAHEAQLRYEVAAGEMSAVQADQLLAEYDKKDSLERQRLAQEERARKFEEAARLEDVTFDVQRDALEAQLQIAETVQEQRDLQLRLLDLAYRQERARLETVLADEQSSEAAKEEARRRLAGLNATYDADRQGVINRTRGPMEEWSAQFGDISEELENLKVNGIMGAVDALTALTGGFDDFRDAAIQAIQAVIMELIRLQLMKLAVNLIGSAAGGGIPNLGGAGAITGGFNWGAPVAPGFAGGGGFNILGRRGFDKNVLALNGLPIANVSYGERVNISNDNASGRQRGMGDMHFHFPPGVTRDQARETGYQAGRRFLETVNRGRA